MHFGKGIFLFLAILSSFEVVLSHSDSEGSATNGSSSSAGGSHGDIGGGEIASGTSSASPVVVKLEPVPLSIVKVEEADRLALVPLTEPNKRQRGDEASGSTAADPHHSSPHSFNRALSFEQGQPSQPAAPAPVKALVEAKYEIKEENQFLVEAAYNPEIREKANKHTKGMMLNALQNLKDFTVDRLKRHRGKAELIMQLAKPAIAATPAGAFGSAIVGIIKGQIPKEEEGVTETVSKINQEIREQCYQLKNYFTKAVDQYELIQSKFAYQQKVFSVLNAIMPFYEHALDNDTKETALHMLARQCTRRNLAYMALKDAHSMVATKETDIFANTYFLNNLYRNHEDVDELFQTAQLIRLHIEQLERIALFCADLIGPNEYQTNIIQSVTRDILISMKELLQNALEHAWPKYYDHLIQQSVTETIGVGPIHPDEYKAIAEGIVTYIQDFEMGLNMNYKYQVLITQDSMRCKQDYSFPEHFDERLQKNVKMSTVLTNYRGMRIYLSRMAIRRWENPDYTPRPELFVQFKERKSLNEFPNLWAHIMANAQVLLPRPHATGIVVIESGFFDHNRECPMHLATEHYGAAAYGHFYHNDRNQAREHQFYFLYSSILYHQEIWNSSGTTETIEVEFTRVEPNDAFTIILKSQNGSVSGMTHRRLDNNRNSLVFTSYSVPSSSGIVEKSDTAYKNKEGMKMFDAKNDAIKLQFTIRWWVEVAIYNPADGKYKHLHTFEQVFGDTIEMVISGHFRVSKVEHRKLEKGEGKTNATNPMEVDEQNPSAIPSGSVPSASMGASSKGPKGKEKMGSEHN